MVMWYFNKSDKGLSFLHMSFLKRTIFGLKFTPQLCIKRPGHYLSNGIYNYNSIPPVLFVAAVSSQKMEIPAQFVSKNERTFQHQDSLPSLPIPPLSHTITKYLESGTSKILGHLSRDVKKSRRRRQCDGY